ncbi:phosphate propanoyltransferase [Halobacillus sp. MO56]
MERHDVERIVDEVMTQLQGNNKKKAEIPIGVSARHCHLKQEDLEQLFGSGYDLTKKADLSQPGQFAANETVTIVGPKGSIEKVRILGPARKLTQVEVSQTDAFKLGLKPPIRESGNIQGSSPVTLVGPKGSIYINEGLIIAEAHIHMAPDDAERYGVDNGDYVKMRMDSEKRPLTFENILIRVSPRYKLEMHIDTDEANAASVRTGDTATMIKAGHAYD